ncbi:MAG TPA: hypothetical protein VHP31_04380 [Caproicibacter sp.]|nr:hypothetical protein [Caproicibacter sp.]
MTKRKSKLVVWLVALAVVCVALKLFISYLFPYSRLLLFVIVPMTAVLTVIFMVKNRRMLLDKRILACWSIVAVTIAFSLLPIDRQLELARFHASKASYNSAVQQVLKEINSSADTMNGRYYLKFPERMLNPVYGCVDYYKKGNSVAIEFPASESLSIVRYYAYFSDSTARDMLEHTERYNSSMHGADRVEELDGSQWAYVFTWGGDLMKPKDPNL